MRTYHFKLYELFLNYQESSNLSLRQFADKIGVSPSFLSLIFKGERNITKNILIKFLAGLSVPEKETNIIIEKFENNLQKNKELKKRLARHFEAERKDEDKKIVNKISPTALPLIQYGLFIFLKSHPHEEGSKTSLLKNFKDYYKYSEEETQTALKALIDKKLIFEEKNTLLINKEYIPKDDEKQSDQELLNQYTFLCHTAAKNYLPALDKHGVVATSNNKDTMGFDVISWDYLFLDEEQLKEFKLELIQFHKKVKALSEKSRGTDLNYYFMGSQFSKIDIN